MKYEPKAKDAEPQPTEQLLVLVLVSLSFLKIMFFMKIFSDYSFLVEMVSQSISKVREFLLFFTLWVLFFSVQYEVLQAGFEDGDYPDLSNFVRLMVLSTRISIGDIQVPKYQKLQDKITAGDSQAMLVLVMIWIVWFFNIGLMLVILMNFLIAVISDSYV